MLGKKEVIRAEHEEKEGENGCNASTGSVVP